MTPQPFSPQRKSFFYDTYIIKGANRTFDPTHPLAIAIAKQYRRLPDTIEQPLPVVNTTLAEELMAWGTPEEDAAHIGMRHLAKCYAALSHEAVFYADIVRENSIKFDVQYSLGLFDHDPKSWRAKPQWHMFFCLRTWQRRFQASNFLDLQRRGILRIGE